MNKGKMMLTDSRFYQRSTILRKTIVTEAVHRAFADGKGERVIKDYRGTSVCTVPLKNLKYSVPNGSLL